jgi:hypothetical protein
MTFYADYLPLELLIWLMRCRILRCFFSFFCSSETNCVQLAVEFHSRFNPTPHSAEKVKFLGSSLHELCRCGHFWPSHCAYVIMNLCRPIHTAFSLLFSTASPCLLLPFATFSCMSAPLSLCQERVLKWILEASEIIVHPHV